jgi:hypothetical protein
MKVHTIEVKYHGFISSVVAKEWSSWPHFSCGRLRRTDGSDGGGLLPNNLNFFTAPETMIVINIYIKE